MDREISYYDSLVSVPERNRVRQEILHRQNNNLHLYQHYSDRSECELLQFRNEQYCQYVDVGIFCPLIKETKQRNSKTISRNKKSGSLESIFEFKHKENDGSTLNNGISDKTINRPSPFLHQNTPLASRSSHRSSHVGQRTNSNMKNNFDVNTFVQSIDRNRTPESVVASSAVYENALVGVGSARDFEQLIRQNDLRDKRVLQNKHGKHINFAIRSLLTSKERSTTKHISQVGVKISRGLHPSNSINQTNHSHLRRNNTDLHPVTTGLRKRGQSQEQQRWRPVSLGERPICKVWARQLENGGEKLPLQTILREDTVHQKALQNSDTFTYS